MNRWLFGMSGMGKTTVLCHEILEDIDGGNGVIVFDPHGDLIDAVLQRVPKERTRDVVLLDPTTNPVGWNFLASVPNKPLVAERLKDTMKALAGYETSPTPQMERVLYNSLAALLEYPNATLLDIEPLLTDKRFREKVLDRVKDTTLLAKWEYWSRKKDKEWDALVSSTENKAGDFSEDPRIRRILAKNTIDLHALLFEQKIVLVRLPSIELGKKTTILGSLVLAYLSAIRGLPPVNVYVDDCQLFDTPPLRLLIENARRLNYSVTVANQYLSQLSPKLRQALLGAAQIRIMFRCGIEDSAYLHQTIPEDNNCPKLHQLRPYQALYFDGRMTERIEELDFPPLPAGSQGRARKVAQQSDERYGL